MEDNNTSIVGLWVPVVVFAHIFSFIWLGKLWWDYSPRRSTLRRKSTAAQAKEDDASGSPKEEFVLTVARRRSGASARSSKQGEHSDTGEVDKAVTRVEQVHLEWQQLSCSYNSASGKIVVLNDVWGQAAPREMQALLGPSGAGKSTLMDILAQRKAMGNLSGFLLVNGQPASGSFIRKTAYVPQEDNHMATMTVSETMYFHADIILPKTWNKADRRARVAEVLAHMGLAHKHKTMVGGTLPGGLMLRGLSGGERKRLSIAAGILAAPGVVFLDEPTSGLDSFAALTVMGHLKKMACDNGHVVIASIHQPRTAIWSMFDKVTLLASGRLMYHGRCDEMVGWFGSLGYAYDPVQQGVPSDWALDLVAIGFHKPKKFYGHTITNMEQLLHASAEFVAAYTRSSGVVPYAGGTESMIGAKSLSKKMQAKMHNFMGLGSAAVHDSSSSCCSTYQTAGELAGSVSSLAGSLPTSAAGNGGSVGAAEQPFDTVQVQPASSKWATSWWRHFTACYGRELLAITRNPADVAGRTMTFAWVAILMGLLYYSMPNDASSIRGRLNMTFNNLVFFCLMPYVSMSLYCADKKFYVADASAKLYRSNAYYLAKVAAITPFQIISALVFCFTIYGMTGLRPGARFIMENSAISTLLLLIAVQVLHCCAILAPNQDVAFMLSIVWTAIQLFFSNYFIIFTEVEQQWITVLRWLSALFYAFEGLMTTEFQGVKLSCAGGMGPGFGIENIKTLLPNNRFLKLPFVVKEIENPGPDCIADTNALLEYYSFGRPFNHTIVILLSYLAICHLCTYLAMIRVARKERR